MADDIGSALNSLKSLLGDNAEEKIQAVLSTLSSNDNQESDTAAELADTASYPSVGGDTAQSMMKIKNIIEDMSRPSDARSNLLMSLKPYMRDSRKQSIDNALKILSLAKLSGIFKNKL